MQLRPRDCYKHIFVLFTYLTYLCKTTEHIIL